MVTETRTWPELGVGLYELLTGRNAEITYTFDKMQVGVPSRVGEGADRADWTLDGSLRISTRDRASSS